MRTSEWEARVAVVELGAQPLNRRMAQLAVLRECRRHVIGTGCRMKFREMARDAGCGRPGKPSLCVTRGAACRNVRAHQWELSARMVKRGRCPMNRSVA